jgi:hypothetical protein
VGPSLDPRSLHQPTAKQYGAFAAHVADAHSWYKHLPLLTGGQFVVFLAPDSGIGRLVARIEGSAVQLETPAEGSLFTEDHPRLHYSWTTSEEYRRRFGFLDYARRSRDDVPFGRDVGGPLELPAEVWERCTFTLYPYVSGGDRGREAVRWAHEEAVQQLRDGAPHPRREAVLEWARLAEEYHAAWRSLTQVEHEVRWLFHRDRTKVTKTTPAVDRILKIEAELDAVYNKQLRRPELPKILRALRELRAWLNGR